MTAPLYLLALGPLVLHEAIKRLHLLVILAVGCGAFLLLLGSEQIVATAPDPTRGNLLAALSGATWALTIVGLRWLGRRDGGGESTMAAVILGNILAFVASLPFSIPIGHIGWSDATVLLYLGVFQVSLAYVALTKSIRRVPGLDASVLLLIEPVFNPIWTWLVHGERPSNLALTGGILIILTTFAASWWQSRTERS